MNDTELAREARMPSSRLHTEGERNRHDHFKEALVLRAGYPSSWSDYPITNTAGDRLPDARRIITYIMRSSWFLRPFVAKRR